MKTAVQKKKVQGSRFKGVTERVGCSFRTIVLHLSDAVIADKFIKGFEMEDVMTRRRWKERSREEGEDDKDE